jgi:hypothetical protein
MRAIVAAALLALATAECPNACSGHGTCGARDSCACYQNYQGNDCSERTCYFGIAHVDTPKGDLNADGYVSGPLTTVITGSEVYPWGTSELYPNADANEGHFYMECSNKGICDRSTGQCECFDGYEGTACVRASCFFDCWGHGTCESIKELAEQKGYNTNVHDAPTDRSPGGSNHHNFDLAVEESYAYDLWDQDKTFGCKCDPEFYGADCSLRKCKYGVDPLFYDNADGVIKQTTVIHLGSKSAHNDNIGGTFRIVFYDVFGEKYVTKQINAARTGTSATSALQVRQALEGLPNSVISHQSSDVTGTPPSAVTVTMQSTTAGVLTTTGTIGAGEEGEAGAGLGVSGGAATWNSDSGYGPEFTVTFNTNPGIIKSIELDTREINNKGSPDYWVANVRQGQFSSRYTNNLGRVQGLAYGSKLLYTNSDWHGTTSDSVAKVPANTMVKIGGQEVRVTGGNAYQLTLSEPYLGASIIPILSDTGASAVTLSTDKITLTIELPGTTIIAAHLSHAAKLYTGGCALTSNIADGVAAADIRLLTAMEVVGDHDCGTDILDGTAAPIYRRTDDTSNQNLYATTDTAVATDALLTTRGSPDVYVINSGVKGQVKAYTAADSRFDFTGTIAETTVADSMVFVNGKGPYTPTGVINGGVADFAVDATSGGKAAADFNSADFSSAAHLLPVHTTRSQSVGVEAGSILALNGRRYKVKSASVAADGKITLTENFAGGQLLQLCSNCVIAVDDHSDVAKSTITSSKKLTVRKGDTLLVGGYVHDDLKMSVTDNAIDSTSIKTSAGCSMGNIAMPNTAGSTTTALSGATLALYREVNTNQYYGSLVTELATTPTYQYVSQCSGRGICDWFTGRCDCFTGYANDNCDTQNMLAM